MVDEKELEEKEYYRNRLRQWRDLGFDTRELEVMLETDFDRLKEMKFDKLREQLHLMTSEESIPKVKKEPRRVPRDHTISAPRVTEYDDVSKEAYEEADPLEDIRKEMAKRKATGDIGVKDLASDFDDWPRHPRASSIEDDLDEAHTPSFTFHGKRKDAASERALDRPPRGSEISPEVKEQLDLLEEEAAIIKRKRLLLEEEEERLRRKKIILAQQSGDEDAGSGRAESDEADEEPALIFVGRGAGRGGPEDEDDLEGEEEVEPAKIVVEHGTSADSLEDDEREMEGIIDDIETIERDMEDGDAGEEDYEDEDYEEEEEEDFEEEEEEDEYGDEEDIFAERPRGAVKKVRRKPRKKAVKKVAKKVVRKRRGRVPKKKDLKKPVLFVIFIAAILIISGVWAMNTPTLTPKISASSDSVSIGEVVTFDAGDTTSSGKITEYTWSFGDDTPKMKGKVVTHIFTKAGAYNVKLKVKADTGQEKSTSVRITVSELIVTVPPKRLDDLAKYDVDGFAYIEDEENYLYTVPNPYPGSPEIGITSMLLDYEGTMTSSNKETTTSEDGFGAIHNVLQKEVTQDLTFDGTAKTNWGDSEVTMEGEEDLSQQVYIDLKTNNTIRTVTSSVTQIEPIQIGAFQVSPAMTSSDNLKAYPDLETVDSQVNIEELFTNEPLNTADPTGLSGTVTKGTSPNAVIYTWTYTGIDNIYDKPAIRLNVTIDDNTLAKVSLTRFYGDIWFANGVSTYVKIHTYVEGKNGTADFKADSTAVMTSFTAGQTSISGTCNELHYYGAHPKATFAAFNMTPPEGDPNHTSHLFSPHEAMVVAMGQSTPFKTFMNSGSPYAIGGNYSEKTGVTWNLTFGKKGSAKGYNIIVTNTGPGTYTVEANEVEVDPPGLARDEIASLLTLESAEAIFKTDDKTATEIFGAGMVDYTTTTLFLDTQTPYPNLDFTLTSVSATEIDYTYTLSKQIASLQGEKIFSVAVNADNGQLMFVQEHVGDIPMLPF